MRFQATLALAIIAVLAAMPARSHEPQIVAPGTQPDIPFPGHATEILADHPDTPAGAAVMMLTVPPKTFGAPPHVHSNEDEHFYVLEGSVTFLDRETTVEAGPGSLAVLPRGHLHGFWNDTDDPARMLLVITPGQFAGFFDAVVAEIRASKASTPDKIGAIIGAEAAKRGVQVMPERTPASARHLVP